MSDTLVPEPQTHAASSTGDDEALNKRARVSALETSRHVAGAARAGSTSLSEQDGALVNATGSPAPLPPLPVEMAPERGFQLQVVREQGLAGQVARVQASNFMGLSTLTMDIGNHVTLVSGVNGSGKSTILRALQVCLMEVTTLPRLERFMREGALSTTVAVTLWNTGAKAWNPVRFGNKITFERSMKRGAGDSFVVRDAGDRVRTMKDGEVGAILGRMGVNVANPLNLTPAHGAFTFFDHLGAHSLQRKYVAFRQATGLQRFAERQAEAVLTHSAHAQSLNGLRAGQALLDVELEAMQQRLHATAGVETAAAGGLSRSDLQLELDVKRQECMAQAALLSEAIKLCGASSEVLLQRQQKLAKGWRDVLALVNIAFSTGLARRGFCGQILVDHEMEQLQLSVQLPGTVVEVTDPRNLASGGEVVFMADAYFAAVGSASTSPFRCVDAFDVGMSEVGKCQALEALLEGAMQQPERQLLLFTAQDLSSLEAVRQGLEARLQVELSSTFLKLVCMRRPLYSGVAHIAGAV